MQRRDFRRAPYPCLHLTLTVTFTDTFADTFADTLAFVEEMSLIPANGRKPWFDINPLIVGGDSAERDGNNQPGAFLIGIAGGSASGKTSVSEQVLYLTDII